MFGFPARFGSWPESGRLRGGAGHPWTSALSEASRQIQDRVGEQAEAAHLGHARVGENPKPETRNPKEIRSENWRVSATALLLAWPASTMQFGNRPR